jgi:hypothetical protein
LIGKNGEKSILAIRTPFSMGDQRQAAKSCLLCERRSHEIASKFQQKKVAIENSYIHRSCVK